MITSNFSLKGADLITTILVVSIPGFIPPSLKELYNYAVDFRSLFF